MYVFYINIWNRLFIQCLVYLLFLLPVNLYSQEYNIADSYFIKDIYSSDIDLDGDNDLIISSASNGLPDSLYFFYNDGIGNLNKFSVCRRNGIFVLCGNIDEDQYPDIITKDGYNILYIKNNGDGTFGEEVELFPTKGNRVIEYIADMDQDGLNDLVYTYNAYYCKWGILKNEGDLLFTDHIIFDDGMGGGNLYPRIGNLNNDSLPDACLSFTDAGTHILINNGDFTFDTTLLCTTMADAQICRLNSILPDDIALFSVNTGELFLYENLGNDEFINKDTLPLTGPVMITDVADYNNDGYDDYSYALCWWTNCTDSIYISINDKNWLFHKPQQYYAGLMEFWFRTESADLNGDNFNDIIMYGYTPQNAFKILWNDGFGCFSYENPVGIGENINLTNKLKIEIKPNPFKNQTMFSFVLLSGSEVSISIYDQLGRKVMTYPNKYYAEGTHSIEFMNDKLSPGMYFLEITIDKKTTNSRKLIIL
jgi:hypothetical protein